MQISVQISGDKEQLAKLRKLGTELGSFPDAMRDIGDNFKDYYESVAFASEGGVYGSRWKNLSSSYQEQKAKRYPGRGILVRTGLMQRSFRYKSNNTSVVIDNTAAYFKYHQSNEPRTRLPRRKMMGINDPLRKSARKSVLTAVNRKLRSTGMA